MVRPASFANFPLSQLPRRLMVALSLWCGAAGIAASQETRPYGDEELLLSYRREGESSVAKPDSVAPADQPTEYQESEIASNPGAPRDPNPLRPVPETTPVYTFPNARPTAAATAPELTTAVGNVETPLAVPPSSSPATPSLVAEPSRYGEPQTPLEAPIASAQVVTTETPVAATPSTPAIEPAPVDPLLHFDPSIQQAAAVEAPESQAEAAELKEPAIAPPSPGASPLAADDFRRLAPRSEETAQLTGPGGERPRSFLPGAFSQLQSLSTAGAGLAVVVGLFFVCMWLLRRSSGAKPTGTLPNEAFAVLGRAPLTPQSFAHLLRVGNKLVLVAVTPEGIQPLTEVVDPIEVDRLTGVCASGRGHGPAAEFQQVLAQLAREPARGFLGAEAAAGGGRRRA